MIFSKPIRVISWLGLWASCVLLVSLPSVGRAQDNPFNDPLIDFGVSQEPMIDEPVKFSAEFKLEEGSRDGSISVTATIAPEWYVYALNQNSKDATPTTLLINADDIEVTGQWEPDAAPKDVSEKIGKQEFKFKKHYGLVTWSAPIKIAEGIDPRDLEIDVTVDGQVCLQACQLFNEQVTAEFGGYTSAATEEFRAPGSHVMWTGWVDSGIVKPGDTVTLWLEGTPDVGWHLYPYSDKPKSGPNQPTLIHVKQAHGWGHGAPAPHSAPTPKQDMAGNMSLVHAKKTRWGIEFEIPSKATAGEYELKGAVAFQVCNKFGCDMPTAADFRVAIEVAEATNTERVAAKFVEAAGYDEVSKAIELAAVNKQAGPTNQEQVGEGGSDSAASGSFNLGNLEVQETKEYSLLAVVLFALLGGFILNFMPCVLPVIGLKVLSFVQQAGSDRRTAFTLNVWYSAGLISVFLILAVLVGVFNQGWGTQSQSLGYQVTMSAIVFVMGLSFLGVWEIPIPGFVGTSKAAEKAEQEGPLAAFIKGIITTILAVPCSGPGMAIAIAWCLGKPVYMVFLIFLLMGLGMALPYIVIGLNPSLVKFLPKPGLWMDKFKQIMGFFLLATVVWLLSTMRWEMVLPTVAFLFGLWVACWMVGQISLSANRAQRLRSWVAATAVGGVLGWLSLGLLGNVMSERYEANIHREIATRGGQVDVETEESEHKLNWKPFTFQALEDEIAAGNTVMIDFTADW